LYADTSTNLTYEAFPGGWATLASTGHSMLNFAGLPTVDPHIIGGLWNSAGTMKISAG
jgi:hypothetical protein